VIFTDPYLLMWRKYIPEFCDTFLHLYIHACMNTAFKYFSERIILFYFPRVQIIFFHISWSLLTYPEIAVRATIQRVFSGAPTPFFPHLLQMLAYVIITFLFVWPAETKVLACFWGTKYSHQLQKHYLIQLWRRRRPWLLAHCIMLSVPGEWYLCLKLFTWKY
jgi:hypothetical protein